MISYRSFPWKPETQTKEIDNELKKNEHFIVLCDKPIKIGSDENTPFGQLHY